MNLVFCNTLFHRVIYFFFLKPDSKDRIIKHPLFVAPFLLFLSLPAICQAKPLTKPLLVEFEQHTGFQKQSLSIKLERHSSSSDITDSSGYAEAGSPPDDKPQRPDGDGVKTPLIESISWPLLFATHMLVDYKLILTIKKTPLRSPFSRLSPEVLALVDWLLQSYWSADSPLFNAIEQQAPSHDHPHQAITVTFGSGHDQHQYQPSESSNQQAPQANTRTAGSFIAPQNTDYRGGNRGPHQDSHTLGLNCFIHPCHGVCQFRPLSDPGGRAERTLDIEEVSIAENSFCSHLVNGYCFICMDYFDPPNTTYSQNNSIFRLLGNCPDTPVFDSDKVFKTEAHDIDVNPANNCNPIDGVALDEVALNGFALDSMSAGAAYTNASTGPVSDDLAIPENDCLALEATAHCQKALSGHKSKHHHRQFICNKIVASEDGYLRPCAKIFKNSPTLSTHKSKFHTGQKTCDVTLVREDGQPGPCGTVCKNAQDLSEHKNRCHSGQQICDTIVAVEDGQLQPCGRVLLHARSLREHKRTYHRVEKTCDVTLVGEDGQPQPCGTLCKSVQVLSDHKRSHHTGQQTCGETLVGENGQPDSCGTVCKNPQDSSGHRNKYDYQQKICDAIVAGKDGQPLPCGKVCLHARTLRDHKKRNHGVQKICDVTTVGEDGQPQPCGVLCKSVQVLSEHKRRRHTGQKTCAEIVVGEDGQTRPCGRIYKNGKALSDHKAGYHTGQKTCNVAVPGEDGRLRPCATVCRNSRALTDHKKIKHTGQQTCDVKVTRKDGQPQLCGTVCKNPKALSDHKRREHTGQQTCYEKMIGKDGQLRPCGKICDNAQALCCHKRMHRKRKHVDVFNNDEFSNPEGKMHK
ncbi:hypothetical protein [Endozoicomonas sp. ALD040]|uniref:hypothetical protein n=1 Tax=unclassified Endozoicomonas TaxID=2644528 RepID=UPI003BB1E019